MKTFKKIFLAALLGSLTVFAVKVLTLDPYGKCRSTAYIPLCIEALLEHGSERYQEPISNETLLKLFNANAEEFEKMRQYAQGGAFNYYSPPPQFWPNPAWRERLGVMDFMSRLDDSCRDPLPATCKLDPVTGKLNAHCHALPNKWKCSAYERWWKVKIIMDRKQYIELAHWPHVSLSKRISYRTEKYLLKFPDSQSTHINELHIDNPCLVQKINKNWAIETCIDYGESSP